MSRENTMKQARNLTAATRRRTGRVFLLLFLLIAVGIVTGGWIYYLNSQRNYRTQIEDQLSAIADLKVGQLVQYRKERIADGSVLFQNESLSALVRRLQEELK